MSVAHPAVSMRAYYPDHTVAASMNKRPNRPAKDEDVLSLDLGRATGYLLFRTAGQWERVVAQAVMPIDLTHTQFFILSLAQYLQQDGQAVTQARIASEGGLDTMMVSQVARRLEDKGLLRRVPHPDDRRARCIELTASGRKAVVIARRAVMRAASDFFGVLGKDQSALHKALQRLNQAFV